jgi:hypothetical protein
VSSQPDDSSSSGSKAQQQQPQQGQQQQQLQAALQETSSRGFSIDQRRTLLTAVGFGAAFVGPVGEFWYSGAPKCQQLSAPCMHCSRDLKPAYSSCTQCQTCASSLGFAPLHCAAVFTPVATGVCSCIFRFVLGKQPLTTSAGYPATPCVWHNDFG